VLNFDRSTVKHAFQNIQNDCFQWLSHSFRVHQIFGRGSAPDPAGGALQRSPDSLAGLSLKGNLLLRGRRGKGKRMGGQEGKERGGEGEGRRSGGEEEGRVRHPDANSWIRPWSMMHFVDIFQ